MIAYTLFDPRRITNRHGILEFIEPRFAGIDVMLLRSLMVGNCVIQFDDTDVSYGGQVSFHDANCTCVQTPTEPSLPVQLIK
jgi:hypothetical protein